MTSPQSKPASAERYATLQAILGKRYIRKKIESPFDFIAIAEKGISANVIDNFRKHFNIPRAYTADVLNVSESTIYRWIRDKKKLERNLSVLLFELTNLFLRGAEVFDDRENFFKWLELPNTALGGMQPRELLEIPGGISKVNELLGRIEYGVYS